MLFSIPSTKVLLGINIHKFVGKNSLLIIDSTLLQNLLEEFSLFSIFTTYQKVGKETYECINACYHFGGGKQHQIFHGENCKKFYLLLLFDCISITPSRRVWVWLVGCTYIIDIYITSMTYTHLLQFYSLNPLWCYF